MCVYIYCVVEHVYQWVCMAWQDDFLTPCLSRMSFQPEIMPCRDDRSIVTNTLQIDRYFIKQLWTLWYKMNYSSFSKMCTNHNNYLDHSIKCAYFYPFIRIQEPFSLDKISQLDLNLFNQIP